MAKATFRIWRGEQGKGSLADYSVEVSDGMVVLDAVHQIPGDAERGSGLPVELQGGEMRVMLGGNQWHAEADVHDPAERSGCVDAGDC